MLSVQWGPTSLGSLSMKADLRRELLTGNQVTITKSWSPVWFNEDQLRLYQWKLILEENYSPETKWPSLRTLIGNSWTKWPSLSLHHQNCLFTEEQLYQYEGTKQFSGMLQVIELHLFGCAQFRSLPMPCKLMKPTVCELLREMGQMEEVWWRSCNETFQYQTTWSLFINVATRQIALLKEMGQMEAKWWLSW